MSQQQHTPTATPWHTESGVESEQPSWIVGANGEQIAQCYSDYVNPVSANAAHIVRCVNSHDALVKALKDMLRAVNDCIEDGSLDADAVKKHDSTIQARAALALAKEA